MLPTSKANVQEVSWRSETTSFATMLTSFPEFSVEPSTNAATPALAVGSLPALVTAFVGAAFCNAVAAAWFPPIRDAYRLRTLTRPLPPLLTTLRIALSRKAWIAAPVVRPLRKSFESEGNTDPSE